MVCIAAATDVRADERNDFERLRLNFQYTAAAELAQSRLDRSDLTPRERAEWCVEYIRARTEQALNTPGDRRTAVWQDADKEAESFIERNPSNPALVLVRVQAALALLARGEFGRQEARLLPETDVSEKATSDSLSAGIAALDKAAASVRGELTALDQKKSAVPDGLSRQELTSLERNLRLQLARGYRMSAEGYPTKSPEAIDAAQQAREQLEPLLTLAPESNLGWRSRLEAARSLASERKYGDAKSALDDLKRAKLPPAATAAIEAERIRMLLAAGRVDDALAAARGSMSATEPTESNDLRLTRTAHAPNPATAELKIARLEAIVAAYRRNNSKSGSGQGKALAEEIIALVTETGSVPGPSWRRRAELIVTQAAYENVKLAEAASPELIALRYVREKKIDEAIAAYDRAAEQAKQEKNLERLFAATLAAARLEAAEGKLDAASKRCRQAALDDPAHAQAASVHLWAIEYARQGLISAESGAPPSLVDFHRLLAEHVEKWPGETTETVRDLQQRLSQ
jgi:tetratricopeptide (TPR) repeat protein